MKKKLKDLFSRGFPRNRHALKNSATTYSQLGEDILIRNLLKKRRVKCGYFIDIGSFEPVRYSNSYWLYLNGYTGVAVDPNPDLKAMWKKFRPRDQFVCAALIPQIEKKSNKSKLHYLKYRDRPACNQIVASIPEDTSDGVEITEIEEITFEDLKRYYDPNKECVLLDIDCEGMDIAILNGIDINVLRPHLINLETSHLHECGIMETLIQAGYTHRASMLISHIFERND